MLRNRLLNALQVELREVRQDYIHRFALHKASAQEYVQAAQKRLFFAPLADWLVRYTGVAGACLARRAACLIAPVKTSHWPKVTPGRT